MPPQQAKCLPQIVWVRRFSHRLHGIHRNSCGGYSPTDFTDLHRLFGCVDSPTDFTDFTETLAGDILPQISQINTDCLGAQILPQISRICTDCLGAKILPQISQICTDCLGAFKGVHLSQVHQHSKRCTNIARSTPTEQEVHQRSQVGCVSKLASSTPRRGRST